ncbi:MAG: hypothetical protein MI749_09735 [Desulfovibrionales bacterium]|nr:hypothetical protein [Desulfovibrionales bacterium]
MIIDDKYRQLLGKAGFLAANSGQLEKGEVIFNGLAETAPDKVGPILGQALILMFKGEIESAVTKLRNEALALDPEDQHARAYLGMALQMGGAEGEAKKVLDEVVANAQEESARKLATELLAQQGG